MQKKVKEGRSVMLLNLFWIMMGTLSHQGWEQSLKSQIKCHLCIEKKPSITPILAYVPLLCTVTHTHTHTCCEWCSRWRGWRRHFPTPGVFHQMKPTSTSTIHLASLSTLHSFIRNLCQLVALEGRHGSQ